MTSTRDALEAALVRNPDDLTLHMAYADCLIEEGDLRGEWIRLCLAGHDRPKTKKAKKQQESHRAATREFYLRHHAEWLGELSRWLEPPDDSGCPPPLRLGWEHGLLRTVELYVLQSDLITALRHHPLLQMLTSMFIFAGPYQYRDFRLGRPEGSSFSDRPDPYSFLREWPYSRLRHFCVLDPTFGDGGLSAFLDCNRVPSISFQLSHCGITDAGAAMLIQHAESTRRPFLSMEGNQLSRAGVRAMTAAGLRVSAKGQMPRRR